MLVGKWNKPQLLICSKKKKLECISEHWTKKVAKHVEHSDDALATES